MYLEGLIRSRKFNDQAGVEKTKSDDFQKLNSPNIENSAVEKKIDESPQDFDIEDEVPF